VRAEELDTAIPVVCYALAVICDAIVLSSVYYYLTEEPRHDVENIVPAMVFLPACLAYIGGGYFIF